MQTQSLKFYYGIVVTIFCTQILCTSLAASEKFDLGDRDTQQLLEDLLTMSLSDLQYVSSKIPEKKNETPGSVTSYSSEQIRNLGRYTIGGLAEITPGYSVTTLFGEKGLETRGQAADPFENNNHLLLVDGIPVHHARSRKLPIENDMPLFFADQVEFLRGPASALYGTGALNGVINIRPQRFRGQGLKVESRLSAGSPDARRQLMLNAFYNSQLGETSLSFSAFSKNDARTLLDPVNNPEWRLSDHQTARFLFLKHQFVGGVLDGLTPGFIYNYKNSGFDEGDPRQQRNYFPGSTKTWESFIPYIRYEKNLAERMKFSSYFKYNKSIESGFVDLPPDDPILASVYRSSTENYEAQGELFYDFSNSTKLIIGINYDTRREFGVPTSFVKDILRSDGSEELLAGAFARTTPWNRHLAGYGQLRHEYDFLKGTILTAGLRYTAVNAGGFKSDNLSPRLSLVQKLTENLNIKFMYGTAFRAPNIKEVGLTREENFRLHATPGSLTSELFTTKEMSLVYSQSSLELEITAFKNVTRDAIVRTISAGFMNIGGDTKSYGTEFSFQYRLNDKVSTILNYTYAQTDRSEEELVQNIPIIDLPKHRGNLIVNYSDKLLGKPIHVTVVNNWVHSYTAVSHEGHKHSGYFKTDLNLRLAASRHVTFELQTRNLFNTDNRLPVGGIALIPITDRTIMGSLVINMDYLSK